MYFPLLCIIEKELHYYWSHLSSLGRKLPVKVFFKTTHMPEALEHRLQLLAYRLVPYSRWGRGCIPSNVRRSHHKNLPNEPLCGSGDPCFVHNGRCSGLDGLCSIQIHTLYDLA